MKIQELLISTNRQTLFNTVIEALVSQARPALNHGSPTCASPDGCRCAVGHCLTEAGLAWLREHSWTGFHVTHIVSQLEDFSMHDHAILVDLLERLQAAHDGSLRRRDLLLQWRQISHAHRLSPQSLYAAWVAWSGTEEEIWLREARTGALAA